MKEATSTNTADSGNLSQSGEANFDKSSNTKYNKTLPSRKMKYEPIGICSKCKTEQILPFNSPPLCYTCGNLNPLELDGKEASPEPEEIQYPELLFPYEAIEEGSVLKSIVDNCCGGKGKLSPGLIVPAILVVASSIPVIDTMNGGRINEYATLLALVGAGKDVAIDRALATFGMEHHPGYAPSGERSLSQLLGDHPRPRMKGEPDQGREPGPATYLIHTYEMEDTLNKSKGDTSSVLQALQHYYDHNQKKYSDHQKREISLVDCRLSWLAGLQIGDKKLDPDRFTATFGESTTHGMVSRHLFGFAEKRFNIRKERDWVPYREEVLETGVDNADTNRINLLNFSENALRKRLEQATVIGWEDGVEELYENWSPGPQDMSGRDPYHAFKICILTALINSHKKVTLADWNFAVEMMEWQQAIRREFEPGESRRITQGEFNEKIMKTIRRVEERWRNNTPTKTDKEFTKSEQVTPVTNGTKYQVRYYKWKRLAHHGDWHLAGFDIEKTIDGLVRAGFLIYKAERVPVEDARDLSKTKEVNDKQWVRLSSGE